VAEGLADVGVRARQDALAHVALLAQGREQDDRHLAGGRRAAQAAGHLEAVELGHRHVQHRQVGPFGLGERERLAPVARGDRAVAGPPEAEGHQFEDVVVVVGHQHRRLLVHAAPSVVTPRSPVGPRGARP